MKHPTIPTGFTTENDFRAVVAQLAGLLRGAHSQGELDALPDNQRPMALHRRSIAAGILARLPSKTQHTLIDEALSHDVQERAGLVTKAQRRRRDAERALSARLDEIQASARKKAHR